MWTLFGTIALYIYIAVLCYITLYCFIQLHLLYTYKKKKHKQADQRDQLSPISSHFPHVTIQLPIFNEKHVIARLIDSICALDYPKDKLQIHILDDSIDETVDITHQKVLEYQQLGFDIEQIRRQKRQGFKAGALKDAMPFVKGEFIAIFDADFLPNTTFLKQTLPYFNSPEVGVVQTRWEHINQDFSLITKLQAFHLNVHFSVEQKGRELGKYFLQFNGTAGVWRRATIDDAGGWEADTLTEDLDLSYRAQLKGWKIVYREEIGSPAELPVEMNGLKSQQFRWMKGGAETAKKVLPKVWKSPISFTKKMHASGHLLGSSIFIFVFLAGVFSLPVVLFLPKDGFIFKLMAAFFTGMISLTTVYFIGNFETDWKGQAWYKIILKFLFLFPLFLSLSMGLSLHNSVAVIQGFLGKKSPFVRTPKFNIQKINDSFKKSNYLANKLPLTTVFEGIMCLYFILGVLVGIINGNNIFLIYHIILALGFGGIFYLSVRHLSYRS